MKILFLHQNFPGQFKHIAPALVSLGHKVIAIKIGKNSKTSWEGVEVIEYTPKRKSTQSIHPWLVDLESKVIRGESVFNLCRELKTTGFTPSIIVAHPGWGESMFIKDVWPNAKLLIYCEYYYLPEGGDVNFDSEFISQEPIKCRLTLKNLHNQINFNIADWGISPTNWQASTFPEVFRKKISVIHDGIDTTNLKPDNQAAFKVNEHLTLNTSDEVITFSSRNLEPYRGYHTFMRALPYLMQARPKAHIIIIGGEGTSYGTKLSNNETWKSKYLNEVKDKVDEKRIHFVGKLAYNDYVRALQISSLHVYLTYPFVLSWGMLEAMSLGCIVLGSNTNPVKEIIEDGINGFLTDFFKAEDLAQKANLILDLPKETQDLMRSNARQHIQKNYELKSVCLKKQIELIQNLASL